VEGSHLKLFRHVHDMKRILLLAVTAMMTVLNGNAQNIPVGIRMEVAESEGDKSEYSIFTYKDEDGSFGYYLSLGRITSFLEADEILGMSVENIKEMCICLGSTSDEAFAALDSIIDLYNLEVETSVELQGRTTTDGGRLGEPTTSVCTVKKKPLGGKRLEFLFSCGSRQGRVYLTKSVVKELRMEFRMDKRLHPSQHR